MVGELLFGGLVWGSVAAVLVAFGYVVWLLVSVRR
jgi:hypothetical protein